MATAVTYYRYKEALQRIANGDDDAAEIAREALERKVMVKRAAPRPPRTKMAEIIRERGERDLTVLRQFIDAGCPAFTVFARQLGWTEHRAKRRLFGAARYIIKHNAPNVDAESREVADEIWRHWDCDWNAYWFGDDRADYREAVAERRKSPWNFAQRKRVHD